MAILGHQSTGFNSMANIQIGGKLARNGRSRVERAFTGVIAGVSINRLRVLDLAAERDPHTSIRGDVQLVTGVLDRNDLQRMQQVRNFCVNNVWIKLKKKRKTNRTNKYIEFDVLYTS